MNNPRNANRQFSAIANKSFKTEIEDINKITTLDETLNLRWRQQKAADRWQIYCQEMLNF